MNKSRVSLREVSVQNVRSICGLSVKEEQKGYVVSNAVAIAEACYGEDEWIRAVYADEAPVGLAVLKVGHEAGRHILWRLMIDARYQGSDIGRHAVEILVEYVRQRPNDGELLTSVVPGEHCPQGFYERLGFCLSGEWQDGEAIMRLTL